MSPSLRGNPVNKYLVGDIIKRQRTRDKVFQRYDAPIRPMIEHLETEYVCEKTKGSASFGTPLRTSLHKKGIDCVLVARFATLGCVGGFCR